ncbi:MAG: hypothetical protein ABI068_03355 [Ktedonobacterales bacterium]
MKPSRGNGRIPWSATMRHVYFQRSSPTGSGVLRMGARVATLAARDRLMLISSSRITASLSGRPSSFPGLSPS